VIFLFYSIFFYQNPKKTAFQMIRISKPKIIKLIFFFCFLTISTTPIFSQKENPILKYTISILDPAKHSYMVELKCSNWKQDTIRLKMPKWMPGYYQIMDYTNSVENLVVKNSAGKNISFEKTSDNTWVIGGVKNKPFSVQYTINTSKQFVANSYVDEGHAYIIPENTFLYIDGLLNNPVSIKVLHDKKWSKIATGLEPVLGKTNEFFAPDFDILYDCPILIGNIETLPSFKVKGVEHQFVSYNAGPFDHKVFMEKLKKVVEASVEIIGDIPFKKYTFIGIGPGRGGIEHLNNTTISFVGDGLEKPENMNRVLNFIAHEYFHHYNVKRIRPFELGPFDYEKGNRTNLLWISEGLTVYYEYLILKRAGLVNESILFENFEQDLDAHENNPGKQFQSLQQASYKTWSDGPFGKNEPGKAISYYEKGPLVGLLLDFEIRNATQNRKSLDDVMRNLYWNFYKKQNRGFTEAEFQASCEQVAGISLNSFFEYIYTTKQLDYAKYLAFAGLKIEVQNTESKEKGTVQKFKISKIENPNQLQKNILEAWMGK
jgi:predicted metalloprotease with PDZ domain